MNRILALSRIAVIVWLLPAYSHSMPTTLDGTWYDEQLLSYVFLHGEVMRREWSQYSEREEAQYVLDKTRLTVRFADKYPQSGVKPLVLTGSVDGDVISVIATGGGQDGRSFRLHRAPHCEGEPVACGSGVFCTNSQGQRPSYWKLPATRPSPEKAKAPEDFNDFLPYFSCAVHLKLRDLYVPHVSFPLRERLLFPDRYESTQIADQSFKAEILEKDMAGKNYQTYEPILRGGRISVYVTDDYRIRNRVHTSEKEWYFEKQQGIWRLVMLERPAMPPDTGKEWSLPWFQLKHCSDPALRELAASKIDTAQGEDFEIFVIQFYCALKKKQKDWYIPRVRLPLPFIERTTEGESRGTYRRQDNFDNWTIAAVDGGEVPLVYSAQGNSGLARMSSRGAGTSNTWIFQRIGGKWYLVRLEIGSY